jgi:O-antigen ligase
VHLGALLAGTVVLLGEQVGKRRFLLWLTPIIGAALSVSGSRFGTLAAGAAVVASAKRWGARRTVVVAALLLVGFVGAAPLLRTLGTPGGTPSVAAKGVTRNDFLPRLYVWQSSIHPIARRPVLGFGPGRFVAASGPVRPVALARSGPEVVFTDAHNLFVEYAVTTGLVGAAALVTWLVLACRAARGPLLFAGCAILAVYLVEPLFVGTVPVAFLLLGAGTPPAKSTTLALRRTSTTAWIFLGVLAVASGVALLVGDFAFR